MPFVLVIGKEEDLKFGMVKNIYIDGASVFFEFVPVVTKQFLHHYHAHALAIPATSSNTYLINHYDLIDFRPHG